MEWDPMDEEDYSQMLEHYMEIGAVELIGMDEDGEVIYEITEAAAELAPELWESHIQYVDDALLGLFEKGLIEIEYTEDLEAMIKMTPEGYEEARKLGLIDPEEFDIPND